MARPRKPRGATTKGGWGHNHQRRRAALAPYVNAGNATCCRCHQPIERGEEWHLDHNDSRDGYLGVSHATCNLAAGAHRVNGKRRPDPYVEQPYRWSQRWREDPPPGTVVFNGGNPIEVYTGTEWITVAREDVERTIAQYRPPKNC